jgi:hypothetical protein
VDGLGLAHYSVIERTKNVIDWYVSRFKCCCAGAEGKPVRQGVVYGELEGSSQGNQVTLKIKIAKKWCEPKVVSIWWHDCVTAQREERGFYSGLLGRDWKEWGWYGNGGADTITASHTGSAMEGHDDDAHWDWKGAIIYTYCDPKKGRYHAAIADVQQVEYTWDAVTSSWTGPQLPKGQE